MPRQRPPARQVYADRLARVAATMHLFDAALDDLLALDEDEFVRHLTPTPDEWEVAKGELRFVWECARGLSWQLRLIISSFGDSPPPDVKERVNELLARLRERDGVPA